LSYTSSSSPAINKPCRLPATSVINSPWSVAAECIALGVHSTRSSQLRIAISSCPTCIQRPRLGSYRRKNIAMMFSTEKLEWFGYPIVKNEDMFIHFDKIHDRQTDRHTDTARRHRPRLHSISRGKKNITRLLLPVTADSPPSKSFRTVKESMTELLVCSKDDVRRIVMASPTKSCTLDQYPRFY